MKLWLPILASILCASVALAEAPVGSDSTGDDVLSLVRSKLIKRMRRTQSKRKMFSRSAAPPLQRFVRVLDRQVLTDARGKRFVRFAIDQKHPGAEDWKRGALTGCAYPDQSEVFVHRGDGYVAAKHVLKAGGKVRTDVCEPAPELAAATVDATEVSQRQDR